MSGIRNIRLNKDLEEISKDGVVSKMQDQLRELDRKKK